MSLPAFALRFGVLLTCCVLMVGCSSKGSRCKSDGDCKGSRICESGECTEPASGTPAPEGKAAPPQPGAAPAPQPPAAAPGGQAAAPAGGDPTVACVTPPPQNRNGVLRTGPSLDAQEIAQVPRGTDLKVIGESGLFYQVLLPSSGHRGWMNRNAVTYGPCPAH